MIEVSQLQANHVPQKFKIDEIDPVDIEEKIQNYESEPRENRDIGQVGISHFENMLLLLMMKV